MRIAVIATSESPGMIYRAYLPARMLAARGHSVQLTVAPDLPQIGHVSGFDVVFIYRFHEEIAQRIARKLGETSVAVVWDNDDDLTHVAGRVSHGALHSQRAGAGMQAMAGLAHVVTTTSEALAAQYREFGGGCVRVVENYLPDDAVVTERPSHESVVIGWTACDEHQFDLEQLSLRATLRRLLDTHADVRVESLGLHLGIDSDRYRCVDFVPYADMMGQVARYDIGIAPLADYSFNWARSNVKLKEYAAAGLPWLASPIGPYAQMGSREGGRLVDDDCWYDELARMVTHTRMRRKLAKRAAKWSRTQTITGNGHRWEQAFTEAVERARSRRPHATLARSAS